MRVCRLRVAGCGVSLPMSALEQIGWICFCVIAIWLIARDVRKPPVVKSLANTLPGYRYLPDLPNSIVAEYAHEYARAQLTAADQIWSNLIVLGVPDPVFSHVSRY